LVIFGCTTCYVDQTFKIFGLLKTVPQNFGESITGRKFFLRFKMIRLLSGFPFYVCFFCLVCVFLFHGTTGMAQEQAPPPVLIQAVRVFDGELELLTIAGLTNEQALMAATSRAADNFRLKDRGRIRQGMRADLVLVRGNPLDDIKCTRNIVRIWKAGYPIDRDKRRKKIEQAKQRNNQR